MQLYSTEEIGFTHTRTMLSTRRIKKTTVAVERPVSTAGGGEGGAGAADGDRFDNDWLITPHSVTGVCKCN
jgi:hypothetical protein